MSCEKNGGPYDRTSLIDGTVEKVHFPIVDNAYLYELTKRILIKPIDVKSENLARIKKEECDLLGR